MTMPADRHARLVELFLAAVELRGEDRTAYLDRACGDDAALRAQIVTLLQRDGKTAILDTPALGIGAQVILDRATVPAAPVPQQIGPYTILGVLGEGGMGTVYRARQTNPERLVALKVIRSGLPTKSLIRRFHYEAQILGRLQHPAIAQVFEAGHATHEKGAEPFIAMELVNGVALDTHVQRKQPALPEKLALFQRIAHPVHHAHCHGVIHRDLKPSNILVDPAGNPKILDFGLARLTDSDVAAATVDTEYGRIQGTLAYMSPEQARADPDRIDLLTDVYALGIILYELITGQKPYDTSSHSLPDALRAVCEQPPRRLKAIDRTVPKDLELIVLKAIEKDRPRRYQSVAEFSSDIERFQNRQPVMARPASTFYQLRKLVSRHKVPATMLAIFILSLAVFAGWMTMMYREAERLRVTAETARTSERQQRVYAESAEREARTAADTAEEISRFLQGMLSSIDPAVAQGRDTTLLRRVLEQASARLERELGDQPVVQAEIRRTIGRTYHNLGLWDEAETHLRAALDLQRAHLSDPHENTARTLNRLGALLSARGKYAEAQALFREALATQASLLGGDDPGFGETLCDYAWLHVLRGEYAEAESKLRRAVAIFQPLSSRYSDGFTRVLNDLGIVRYQAGDYEEAEQLLHQALSLRRSMLPQMHPYIASNLNNLAAVLQAKGDDAAAVPLYRESLAIRRKTLGATHTQVGTGLNNLAVALQRLKRWDESEASFREAAEVFRAAHGEEHPKVAHALSNLGDLLRERGRLTQAEEFLLRALAMRRKLLGDEHPDLARSLVSLGELHLAQRNADVAEGLIREALRIREAKLPSTHWLLPSTRGVLGSCLAARESFEEAEVLLLNAYKELRSARGDRDSRTVEVLRRLVAMYEAWGRRDRAAEYAAVSSTLDDSTPVDP